MKVTVITRIQNDTTGRPGVDVFVGKTLLDAKIRVVNEVMTDWFQERVDAGEEEETDNVNQIYDTYTEFWDDEEIWDSEEFAL